MECEIEQALTDIDLYLFLLEDMLGSLPLVSTEWNKIYDYLIKIKAKMKFIYGESESSRVLNQMLRVDILINRIRNKINHVNDM